MRDSPLPETDDLLDHIESPYHKGRLERPTCVRTERNPLCGDQVQLQLLIEDGRIRQAWFDGRGCTISQAAASMLCELVEGRPLISAQQLQPQDLLALLGVPLSPVRQHCALLALRALSFLSNSGAAIDGPRENQR